MSAADRDFEFLSEYLEETFYDKFKKWLDEMHEKGQRLEFREDMYADKGKPMWVEANIYDIIVIKGLTMNRK